MRGGGGGTGEEEEEEGGGGRGADEQAGELPFSLSEVCGVCSLVSISGPVVGGTG